MSEINVFTFTEYPGLRHCSISDDSGEEFYHKVLNKEFKKCFENQDFLTVNLDGTAGYAPSFLDEAFGNLVYDFGLISVKKILKIISEEETDLIDLLENETFKQWEQRRVNKVFPKKTIKHDAWFKLIDNNIILSK